MAAVFCRVGLVMLLTFEKKTDRLWVTGGAPMAAIIGFMSMRLMNCPKPARTAVLPFPNTSHAIPKRNAGDTAFTVYSDCGSTELGPATTMPGKEIGRASCRERV